MSKAAKHALTYGNGFGMMLAYSDNGAGIDTEEIRCFAEKSGSAVSWQKNRNFH